MGTPEQRSLKAQLTRLYREERERAGLLNDGVGAREGVSGDAGASGRGGAGANVHETANTPAAAGATACPTATTARPTIRAARQRTLAAALDEAVAVAAARRQRRSCTGAFVTAQIRFVGMRTWIALAACVALIAAAATGVAGTPDAASAGASRALDIASLGGAGIACAALPALVASKARAMAELEASCLFNAHAVACARMAIIGCVSLCALLAAIALCARVAPFASLVAHAIVPYLVACAGGLLVARRAASPNALTATLSWSIGVLVACAMLRSAAPAAFSASADAAWFAATLAAALWCSREIARWLDAAAHRPDACATGARIRTFR